MSEFRIVIDLRNRQAEFVKSTVDRIGEARWSEENALKALDEVYEDAKRWIRRK